MKKKNILILFLLLFSLLSGCVSIHENLPNTGTTASAPVTSTKPSVVPNTAPPTTVPPTTVAPTTVPPADEIIFVDWSETISRNETAEVTIQGKPNTEYSITVYYKSGPSSAKGLESKTSDSNGYVTWTWKVGGRTSPGTFRIVVSVGGTQNTVNFTVIS